MRINTYQEEKSSFLSIEKDMGIITQRLMTSENLKKLLYYTTPDCLKMPNLTEEQSVELFNKNIKMVPKLVVDNSLLNYVIVSFDNFTPNASNPEFRDNIISFDIICNFEQWQLEDFKLRPYKIAAEIDSLLNGSHLTGIGEVNFLGANQLILNEDFSGLSLMYEVVHGGEDKFGDPNPYDELS